MTYKKDDDKFIFDVDAISKALAPLAINRIATDHAKMAIGAIKKYIESKTKAFDFHDDALIEIEKAINTLEGFVYIVDTFESQREKDIRAQMLNCKV